MKLDNNGNLFALLNEKDVTQVDLKNTDVFNSPKFSEVGITDGLVAYYPLDGNAKDYTMNRNDGTVVGATVAPGIQGKLCYEFDPGGVNAQYIRCNVPAMNPTSHTISGWFLKGAHLPKSYPIFLSYSLPYIACDGLRSPFRLSYTAVSQVSLAGTTIPSLNVWYHVVATFNTSGANIYVNGVKEGSNSTLCTNSSAAFDLGRHYNSTSYWIDGKIQNVRIYNRALSAEEITILYDLEKPNPVQMKVSNDTVYISGEFDETTN